MKTTGNIIKWLLVLLTISFGAKLAEAQFARGLLSMHGGADDSAPSPFEAKAPPATGGSATAIKWAESPINIKVGVAGWVIAESNTTVNIILNNVTNTITGIGTNDTTNVIPFFITTRTMEPVEARVEGAQIKQVYLEFIKPNRADLSIGGRNRGKEPKGYRIYIDEEEKMWVGETHTNGLGSMNLSWKVLLKAELKSGPGGTVEDVADDVAPGDAGWPQLGPGLSDDASKAGIKWEVNLGRLRNGKSAGKIRIAESGITSNSYSPWILLYEPPVTNMYEVQTTYNSDGLSSVRAPQTLLVILTNSTGFEMRFCPRPGFTVGTNEAGAIIPIYGENPTGTNAFVVWKISNPDTNGAANRLQFEEVRSSNTWVSLLSYDSTNATWRLEYGVGNEKRIEDRRIGFINSPVADRLETNVVMNASNQVSFICVERYHPFEWGWEMISTVMDPAGAALETEYAYYDDNVPSLGYSQLKHIVYADGFWEKRVYSGGALRRLLNPWEDAPEHPDDATVYNSKFTEYYYDVDGYGNPYMKDSSDHAKVSNFTEFWLYLYYAYNYIFNEDASLIVYRAHEPWPGNSEYLDGVYNNIGGPLYPTISAKATYNKKAGELLNGLTYATANGYYGRTAYAQHQGIWTGTNFSADTNETSVDWRTIAIFGTTLATSGDTITNINGQDILPINALPEWTTNVISIFCNGLKVREDVEVYSSATNGFAIMNRVFVRDNVGRLLSIANIDPRSGRTNFEYSCAWNGSLKTSATDANGVTTTYSYDSQKRNTGITRLGWSGMTGVPDHPDAITELTLNANGLPLTEVKTAGGIALTTVYSYDLAKRVIGRTNACGSQEIVYYNGGRSVEAESSSGTLALTNAYLDRRPKSIESTTGVTQHYSYHRISGDPFLAHPVEPTFSVQHLVSTNSPRFIACLNDYGGRPSGTNHVSYVLTNGVRTFLTYDWAYGDGRYRADTKPSSGCATREFVGERMDVVQTIGSYHTLAHSTGGGGLLPAQYITQTNDAPTRATMTSVRYVIDESGDAFRITTNAICLNSSNDTYTTTRICTERLTGFTSNLVCETTTADLFGATNLVRIYLDRENQTVTEITTSSISTNLAVKVTVGGLLMRESTLSQAVPSTYTYDALGRQTSVTTPVGITLYTMYDEQLGLKLSQTDFAGNTNYFEYYLTNHINAQQLKCQTDSRGKKIYFAYNSRNQLVQTWGDVPYPEERVYNDYGEMVELHTFRGGTNWQSSAWPTNDMGTPDITRWTYQEATGLLIEKVDAKSNKWTYVYDDLNRPLATVWARPNGEVTIGRTNIYNSFGDIVGIRYSDDVVFATTNLNRLGLPTTIIDDSGEHTLAYDAIGRITSDVFGNVTNSYTYSQFGCASLSVSVGTNTVTQTNAYDSATGRLLTMGANGVTATYSYLTNADLVSGVAFSNSTGAVLTTSKTFEYSSRLKSITNTLAGGSNISSYVYLYDAIHRRTNATLADGSYWRYGYDDRSQLTSAKRYWSGGGVVAGQQYEYSYDSIGNRTVTQSGGSQFGTSLRTATWTVNELNQTITNSAYGYVNIFGEADASATVTVNHESVYRSGDFYRKELLFSNSSGPVYPSVTNVAVINNYGTNGEDIVDQVIGNVWVPKNPETLLYDEDGNMVQDSRWTYRWDAENRLKEMETLSGLATNVPVQKLVFTYDHQGRRASKAVYAWDLSSTNYLLSSLTKFVYDGWNLLAELDVPQGTNAPVLTKSFLWGLDLSGTSGKACGVGGLLAIAQHSTNGLSTHLPCFDGNGHVTALLSVDSSTLSAKYEYAPFGEPLRITGDAAMLNPFRFSTKYTDDETGLIYFGYRYYSPTQGKWISRDPLGEEGGNNLYRYVSNDPINKIDPNGYTEFSLGGLAISAGLNAGISGAFTAAMGGSVRDILASAGAGGLGGTFGSIARMAGAGGAAVGAISAFVSSSLSVYTTTGSVADSMSVQGILAIGFATAVGAKVEAAGSIFSGFANGGLPGAGANLMNNSVANFIRNVSDDFALDAALAVSGTVGVAAGTTAFSVVDGAVSAIQRLMSR